MNPFKEWKLFRKNGELFLLTLPAVGLLFIFCYLPLPGLIVAFKKYNFTQGIWGSKWVGFDNFRFFFTSENAYRITRNTILYNLSFIVLTTVISVAFAVMLYEINRKWMKVYQTVMFLPYFLSWVVVSYVTLSLFDYGDGIIHANGFINKLLNSFGFPSIKWYYKAQYWPFIVTLFQLWKNVGFTTLIYYAGIMGIDPSYYEAAKIDGATKWQMVRRITVPLLSPLIIILFIIEIGKIFRSDFGLFFFVPNDTSLLYSTTDVIDTYVYRALRVVGDIGMSTAVGFYQSVVGLIFVIGSNYIVKKVNEENSLW